MESSYVFQGPPIAAFASGIQKALAESRRQSALRLFIQINDNLTASDTIRKIEMCREEPPLTGQAEYDALIAGLVEYHFISSKLTLPDWVNSGDRFLPSPWYFEEFPLDKEEIQLSTPQSFAHRNVFISESELMSV